jgi:hypothetical protein
MTLRERIEEQMYLIEKMRFPEGPILTRESQAYMILTHLMILAELLLEVLDVAEGKRIR